MDLGTSVIFQRGTEELTLNIIEEHSTEAGENNGSSVLGSFDVEEHLSSIGWDGSDSCCSVMALLEPSVNPCQEEGC